MRAPGGIRTRTTEVHLRVGLAAFDVSESHPLESNQHETGYEAVVAPSENGEKLSRPSEQAASSSTPVLPLNHECIERTRRESNPHLMFDLSLRVGLVALDVQ